MSVSLSDNLPLQLLICGVLSTASGVFGGVLSVSMTRNANPNAYAYYAPLPHHVAPHPGGPSFRFVMVHDVIHERYAKHSPAYYRARTLGSPSDQAVALHHTGRTAEAIQLLQEQPTLSPTDARNLGTLLGLANQAKFVTDEQARFATRQGLKHLQEATKKSLCDVWEIHFIEHLLDAANDPDRLAKVDLLGNELARVPTAFTSDQYDDTLMRPVRYNFAGDIGRSSRSDPVLTQETIQQWSRSRAEEYLRRVGHENDPNRDYKSGYCFDEPMLGLVQYWRRVGPNPHVALCMGETMFRVGQRYIAWTCYERAAQLAPQFWPTPKAQAALRRHCEQRQAQLEALLPPSEVAKLRPRFERELAFGERYQREYQAYERPEIAAGVKPETPTFSDEFHKTHPRIATKPGAEEWYVLDGNYMRGGHNFKSFVSGGMIGFCTAGLASLLFVTLWWWRGRRKVL